LNKEINKKLLENAAESIIESFLKKYSEKLIDFNGEVSHFKSFAKFVQDIVSTKLTDFKEAVSVEH